MTTREKNIRVSAVQGRAAYLDLPQTLDRELMTLDVSGHYARPDVFEFKVHDRSKP